LPNLTPRKSILKSVMRILPVPVNTAVNNDHENIKGEYHCKPHFCLKSSLSGL
jgi:hypothetical protein